MKKVQFFGCLLSFSSVVACAAGESEGLYAQNFPADAGVMVPVIEEVPVPEGSLVFRFTYRSDVADEKVWIQSWGGSGDQEWVRIFDAGGRPVPTARSCNVCACDQCGVCLVCSSSSALVKELAAGESAEWTWDLKVHPLNMCNDRPGTTCSENIAAESGEYVARFCYGYKMRETEHGFFVDEPQCTDVPFEWPAEDRLIEHQVCDCG
jgi:hypothetical protein